MLDAPALFCRREPLSEDWARVGLGVRQLNQSDNHLPYIVKNMLVCCEGKGQGIPYASNRLFKTSEPPAMADLF